MNEDTIEQVRLGIHAMVEPKGYTATVVADGNNVIVTLAKGPITATRTFEPARDKYLGAWLKSWISKLD